MTLSVRAIWCVLQLQVSHVEITLLQHIDYLIYSHQLRGLPSILNHWLMSALFCDSGRTKQKPSPGPVLMEALTVSKSAAEVKGSAVEVTWAWGELGVTWAWRELWGGHAGFFLI